MPTHRGTQCYVNLLRDAMSCIRDGAQECVYGRHTHFSKLPRSVNHVGDESGLWTLVREQEAFCV